MALSSPPQFCTIITEKRDTMHIGTEWSVLDIPEHVLSIEINWIDRQDLQAAGNYVTSEADQPNISTDIAVLVRWAGIPRAAPEVGAPIPATIKQCEREAVYGEGWHRVPEGTILLFWIKYATHGQKTWYNVRWASEAIQDLRWREDKFKLARQCRDSLKEGAFIALEKLRPGFIDSRLLDLDLANPKWGLPVYAHYLNDQQGRASRGWEAEAVGQDTKACRELMKKRTWKEQEEFLGHYPSIKKWYMEKERTRRAANERGVRMRAPRKVIDSQEAQDEDYFLLVENEVLGKGANSTTERLGYGRRHGEQVSGNSGEEGGDAWQKKLVTRHASLALNLTQHEQLWKDSAAEREEGTYRNIVEADFLSYQLSRGPAQQTLGYSQPRETLEIKHLLQLMNHAAAEMEHAEKQGRGIVGDKSSGTIIASHQIGPIVKTIKVTERIRRFPLPGPLQSYT